MTEFNKDSNNNKILKEKIKVKISHSYFLYKEVINNKVKDVFLVLQIIVIHYRLG